MSEAPILVYEGMSSNPGEVFEYAHASNTSLFQKTCPYCRTYCKIIDDDWVYSTAEQHDRAAICTTCGWWSFQLDQLDLNGEGYFYSSRALLKRFRVEDEDVPYQSLVEYISKNNERLRDVSPKKFEELVAFVYRDALGYLPEYVSYGRPDRGIDVVAVQIDSGEVLAIQAKRYKNPIELSQIHQFFGAVVEARHQHGCFVTTSKFRRGCYEVARNLKGIAGIEIDLIDGRRFLEFLQLLNTDRRSPSCPEWHQHGYMVNRAK